MVMPMEWHCSFRSLLSNRVYVCVKQTQLSSCAVPLSATDTLRAVCRMCVVRCGTRVRVREPSTTLQQFSRVCGVHRGVGGFDCCLTGRTAPRAASAPGVETALRLNRMIGPVRVLVSHTLLLSFSHNATAPLCPSVDRTSANAV